MDDVTPSFAGGIDLVILNAVLPGMDGKSTHVSVLWPDPT